MRSPDPARTLHGGCRWVGEAFCGLRRQNLHTKVHRGVGRFANEAKKCDRASHPVRLPPRGNNPETFASFLRNDSYLRELTCPVQRVSAFPLNSCEQRWRHAICNRVKPRDQPKRSGPESRKLNAPMAQKNAANARSPSTPIRVPYVVRAVLP